MLQKLSQLQGINYSKDILNYKTCTTILWGSNLMKNLSMPSMSVLLLVFWRKMEK